MGAYKRSLQKVSKETYTISLPIGWVRKHNLKKGSTVEIADIGSALIIKPSQMQKNKISLDIKKYSRKLIHQLVVGAYIRNIDMVSLQGVDDKTFIHLKKFTHSYLLGSEVEYIPHKHILNIYFKISENYAKRYKILSHMFYLVEWFIKSALTFLENPMEEQIEEIKEMDKEIDKYSYLALRIYPGDYLSRYAMILENIADSLLNIIEIKDLSHKERKKIKSALNTLYNCFLSITTAYSTTHIEKLSLLSDDLHQLQKKLKKEKIYYLTEIIRLMRDMCEIMIDEKII